MDTGRDAQRLPQLRILRFSALGLAGAGALWCIWVTAGILSNGASFALATRPPQALLELAAAASIVTLGLVAGARGAAGGLCGIGLGVAWLVREWANPAAPQGWVFTAGLLFAAAWLPIAARLALSHPLSHPWRGANRAVIAFVALAAFAPAVVRTVTFDPAAAGCLTCPANLLLVAPSPQVAAAADRVGVIVQLAACVLLMGWVVGTMITASTAVRLARAPIAVASAALFFAAAFGYTGALVGGDGTHEAMLRTIGAQSISLMAIAAAMAWDPLRLRLMRRRTTRLVTDLSSTPRPGSLRDELARIVGDPTITLAFPLDDGRIVDESGRVMTEPSREVALGPDSGSGRRSATLLQRDGRPLVVLFHRRGLLDDGGYRQTLARATGLAIGNERLHAELAAQVEDLRRSRSDLVASFDAERRRLERSLHDGAQQRAVSLLLALRLAASRTPDDRMAEAINEVETAIEELRELAHGLYPASLAEEGLASALQELSERATIPLRVAAAPSERLPEPVETTGYAVISATTGRADVASAEVAAEYSGAELVISVSGRLMPGANEGAVSPTGVALEDRVGAVGGTMTMSTVAGRLDVRAVLPCAS